VPGSPLDPRSEGSNGLLKRGATLVTEAEDVIAVLRPILGQPLERSMEEPEPAPIAPPSPTAEPGADERGRIVELLGPTPVSIDDLVRLAGRSAAVVRIGHRKAFRLAIYPPPRPSLRVGAPRPRFDSGGRSPHVPRATGAADSAPIR
jgi:hypothetical protein